MAASSNLWCLGIYLTVFSLDFVVCVHVSKLNVPYLIPPDSVIIKISSMGFTPSLVHQQESSDIFYLTDTGELKSKGYLHKHLGKTFSLKLDNNINYLDQHNLQIKVCNSSSMFSFSEHQYFAIVKENSPRHTKLDFLGDLVINCDDDQVTVKIVSGNEGKFYMKHNVYGANQSVDIFTNGPLDREIKDTYTLVLQAKTVSSEIAQTIIHVHIQDENDEIPKFNQNEYLSSIRPDLPNGSIILKVQATDKDIGNISYVLDGTTDFSIDSVTGEIRLSTKSLSKTIYNFKAVAMDQGGLYSSCSIQISVVPEDLKFVSYHHLSKRAVNRVEKSFETFENESYSKPVFSVASESVPSNGIEQYQLIKASVDIFQVDTRGNVFVKQGQKLDYEDPEQRTITMTFNITNTNSKSDYTLLQATLTVKDVNDEKPRFINEPRPFLATVSSNPSSGELVYELMADDPDSGSSLTYILESAGEGKFEIQNIIAAGRHIGRIVTTKTGNGQYEKGREFSLVVSAQDVAASGTQKSNFEIVKVLVGTRPPQFFKDPYVGYVMENNQAGYKLINDDGSQLSVKAKPFQSKTPDELTDYEDTVKFTLVDERGQTSSLFTMNGHGEVETLQSMDYEASAAHQFVLTLKAVEESTQKSSTTQLIVNLIDVNDNSPSFELSTYTNTTSEGTPVGTTLFSVRAIDKDSGDNAKLEYNVSDDHFYAETRLDQSGKYIGDIKVAKRLDYDFRPDRLYKFSITATDFGSPRKSGLANVVIYVTNINDEPPVFSKTKNDDIFASIREDQNAGSYVTTVQAIDPDGDNVEYYFTDKLAVAPNGPFRIDTRSGLITLTNIIPAHVPSYILNVTAYDDGSCCGGSPKLRSDSVVQVEIKDINNNNPRFPSCNYAPHILENMPEGTFVVQVKAEDDDRGKNGQVQYSVVTPAGQTQSFLVDPVNGTVTSKVQFDRESEQGMRGYPVTIKAEDQAETTQLNSLCTFWVTIDDTNDNPPKFDSSVYTPTIVRSLDVNKVVTTVLATDRDKGINAEVKYTLLENPEGRFRIDPDTGTIFLVKSLSDYFDSSIRLQVKAEDKGTPPRDGTVLVNIKVTTGDQPAPTWNEDYNGRSFIVNETEQVGYKIATFYASSNVPPPLDGVSFAIVDSNGQPRQTSGSFRVESSSNQMNLRLNGPLNFKNNNTYSLRLRVTNQGLTPLSSEIRITINVRDMNNEEPQFEGLDPTLSNSFRGSVPENEPIGVSVFTVKAVDADSDPPNNLVTYSLVSDKYDAYKKFRIDPHTGLITTNATFDREEQKVYYISVMAKDGINSDVPYHEPPNSPNSAQAQVQVVIGDKNDNPPVFEKPLYETDVLEQPPDSSKSIIRVQATDKDDADTLTYSITSGNTDGVFSIRGKTGDIYVARDLDYEKMSHTFTLTITVSDSFYTNTTTVRLHVQDVNDNPPEFSKSEYVITDVVEEDMPPKGGRFLVQVSATDKDTARKNDFVYSISSDDNKPGDLTFAIEPKTGKIFLLKSLDRDQPKGRAEYQFNVLVIDEPNSAQSLIGYAYVKVKPIDINDNKPEFTAQLTGYVPENSLKGKNVMTVRANDVDFGRNGTVNYMIASVNRPVDAKTGMSLFLIDSETGLITSNTNLLDRETLDRYYLPVVAYDNGVNSQSSTATVTIVVTDENDERPKFLQKIYRVNLSESQKTGPVISVSATDDDIDENAKLIYSIENDLKYFSIKTLPSNAGVITVYSPVDFEDVNQRFFNLTVKARDSNPNHFDIAYVEIMVTDANDEKPEFTKKVEVITRDENIPENSLLHIFTAFDKDSPPNNEFTFSIADNADRFYVEQQGNNCLVKIQYGLDGQTLDRETSDQYTVKILAVDKGIPAQTGTATLYINVNDLNDEAPTFAKPYRPIVMEDENPPQPVITFSAVDRDTRKYGPPFKFELPPCQENPTCLDNNLMFELEFIPSGDGGNGTGKVTAMKKFFREEKKFYYLPIIMKDMGGNNNLLSRTGTSTLTIEIGDKNNNQHYDGFKEIFVYNYKGLFGDVVIGRANANDLDDWDHKDKWYHFIGPKAMTQFFSVNPDDGMITMKKGVPGGVFEFKVLVYDHVVFNKKNATATIRVTVKEISDNAVYSSGSLRLKGVTAEQFVDKPAYKDSTGQTQHTESYYEKFQMKLAQKLGVDIQNVELFSVMYNETTQYLDIRYAAHGSPWYPPSKIDGIVLQYKTEFETVTGGTVVMVNIDECLKEICDSGGCHNKLVVDEQSPVMINTKGKSFVGIGTRIIAECQCFAKNFTKPLACQPGYCFNGGTCSKDDWGDLSCSCLPGFNGKRCQQTHHSFNEGYTVYPPLQQCEDSTTSIEFITTRLHGLLFYNGPVDKISPDHPKDFISLELMDGYPILYLNHGTGTLKLQLDGKGHDGITRMRPLNDGFWHHIDINRNGQHVTMIVDHCSSSFSDSTTRVDRKSCEVSGSTLGRNKYLNVNTVLQMGGRYSVPEYPPGITSRRFVGCIRNFYHNGELYDLHTGVNHPGENHQNGCQREDSICGTDSVTSGSKCGDYGRCEMVNWDLNEVQCVCEPGYRPADENSVKCEIATTIRDLEKSAFMAWELKDQFLQKRKKHELSLQMQFRTRDTDGGVLFHLPSTGDQFITLEIVNDNVQARYNFGDQDASDSNILSLSDAKANNGQWHTVEFRWSGQWVQLKMDNGEGRYFNETFEKKLNSLTMNLRKDRIVSGARLVYEPNARYEARGLSETCVTDIRLDNKWLPMTIKESSASPVATMTLISNVKVGCHRPDCDNSNCQNGKPISKVCYPLWGTYECRCPKYSTPISSVDCVPILYCSGQNPCYSGGTCIELNFPGTFRCKCPPGWTGELCNQQAVTEVAQGGVTTLLLVIIFVSIFAVLLIALLSFLLVMKCNKRNGSKSILYDDQYDDIRENVIDHDEEGAGEEDQDVYDVSRLRGQTYGDKGYHLLATNLKGKAPYGDGGVEKFIEDRLERADGDPCGPPPDNVMEFAYEGGDSDVGSLSSLNTNSSDGDQDYNYLDDWGPKFAKLANMYGGGEEEL